MHPSDPEQTVIHFYATASYPCSYLADRQARSQVAVPVEAIDATVYSQLVRMGFRRSGYYTYRPYCENCQACVPVRLQVNGFMPGRSLRRVQSRHARLTAQELPLAFKSSHFELYRRYQQARHPGGGMSDDSVQQYTEFILKSRVDSRLIEFSLDGELKMVSLVDLLDDGLSAVYTFYAPEDEKAGYGNYAVLWQIARARALGLPYLYLGYWIAQCRKMVYKSRYQPLERLVDGVWSPF